METRNQTTIEKCISYQREVRGLAERTCTEYTKELRTFAAWSRPRGLRWSTITKQDIDAHIAELTRTGHKPATIKKRLAGIRCLFTWAKQAGMISENPARWCQSPKVKRQLPKQADIKAIDAYLQTTPKNAQDAEMHCVVAVMVETGVRLSELKAMRREDFCKADMSIKVTGKGGKQRLVFYGQRTRTQLNAYKRNTQGSLFNEMSEAGIRWEMYKTLGKYCSRVHPHQLRHTFACEMLNNGMDLKTLSVLMGHESVTTTEIYAKASASRLANIYSQSLF